MWDLSYLTKDQTVSPALGEQNLNHWTTREVPFFNLNQYEPLDIYFVS